MSDDEFTSPALPTGADPMSLEDNMDEDDFDGDETGKEKKLTADGGVIKKVITPGSGWETPEQGDKVTVHYVGTLLDGTKFDSSRDRGEPFVFDLGVGSVIKGWDTGVAAMKKGEVALLTCAPEYAYGAGGSPPKIPPNSTLNFEVELLHWQSVKDLTRDGGVIKTVLVEGKDWAKPEGRDEVKVHYKAKVEGASEYFAESPEGGVEFTLKDGHLCRGLVIALETMKTGEKAHLVLKPEYGFGDAGQEPGVPPNSKLEVEVELAGWKKVEDVTEDGGVVKKVLEEGEGYNKPKEGGKVTVRYTARLADGTVVESHPEGSELTFTVDEEQVVEGLDRAVLRMAKGERALLTVAPAYAYGDAGKQEGLLAPVPPGATLSYELEVVDFENPKESWDMSDAEKVEAAKELKEKGNAAFKAAKYKRAVHFYDKAVGLILVDKNFPDELKSAAKEVKKSCWLNLAACLLKAGEYKKVVEKCGKVLELETNVKALYRRASAFLATQDFLEADLDIRRGLEIDEKNEDLLALQKKVKAAQRISGKKEAQLYGRMFGPRPTPVAPSADAAAPPAPTEGAAPMEAEAANDA